MDMNKCNNNFLYFLSICQILIEEGAIELAIPGNFPIGCNAAFLSTVDSKKKEDYDEFGCLIPYNTLVEYFNEQLKNAIEILRQKNPQAKIIYFDYYNDANRLYQTPQQYGMCHYYLFINKNNIIFFNFKVMCSCQIYYTCS